MTQATGMNFPWHSGEVHMHERLGVKTKMAYQGQQAILDHIAVPHQRFLSTLPYIVVGTADADGCAWATVLDGKSGFVQAQSPVCMRVVADRVAGDPAWAGIQNGRAAGFLGIHLAYRRRIRINGCIDRVESDVFTVGVLQSYGNCQQYIHQRVASLSPVRDAAAGGAGAVHRGTTIDARAARLIRSADTFFIASYADVQGQRQMDVSHRGGKPGFVRIDPDGALTIPDFAGNQYFNTLGNIVLNPRCGLTFVDFDHGDVLQLTGRADLILESPEIAVFPGAERLIRFWPEQTVFRPGGTRLRWRALADKAAPGALRASAGDGREKQAQTITTDWRPFRISGAVDEGAGLRSVYLEPADGLAIWPYQPGQYVQARLKSLPGAGGHDQQVERCPLLSLASDEACRIAIPQGAPASDALCALGPGDAIELKGPEGRFILDTSPPPKLTVLVAAGSGIAPVPGLMRQILTQATSAGVMRPAWIVYAAESVAQRAFDIEMVELVRASSGLMQLTRMLSDVTAASEHDYEYQGQLDAVLFRAAVLGENGEVDTGVAFYLSAPPPLAQPLYHGLRALGVPDENIRVAW